MTTEEKAKCIIRDIREEKGTDPGRKNEKTDHQTSVSYRHFTGEIF